MKLITKMTAKETILELQKTASVTRLVWITCLAIMPDLQAYFGFAFAAPAIVYYSNSNATSIRQPLSADQVSWFASSMSLFTLLSSFFGSALIDLLGRKRTMLIATLIELVGWWILQISQEFPILLVNRMTIGLSMGIAAPCTITYLSDIAPIHIRGTMGTLSISVKNLACTLCLVLVAILEFQLAIVIMSAAALPFLLCYSWLPESPQWLVSKNRMEAAEKALLKIRGSHYDAQTELLEMKMIQESEEESGEENGQAQGMMSAEFIRPCIITVFMGNLMIMSGSALIFTYSLEMVRDIKLPFNNYLIAIAIQVGSDLGFWISMLISAFIPKRPLLLTCTSSMIICNALAFFSLNNPILEENNWLLPFSMIASMFIYCLGVSPVMFTMLGELFPPKLKGRATGIFFGTRHLTMFVILKMYPSLRAQFGLPFVFFGQTISSFLTVVFAYLFMPETHRLSLTELSQLYKTREDTMPLIKKDPDYNLK